MHFFSSLQVKSKLKGHTKRITGLAFSHVLNVLVSSGADAQVIIVHWRSFSGIPFLWLNCIKRLSLVSYNYFSSIMAPFEHAVGNALPLLYHIYRVICLLCRFVCGILTDGKSRSLDSCNFLLGGLHQHRQIPVYNFIRTRSASWLYMKHSLPFMKQQS